MKLAVLSDIHSNLRAFEAVIAGLESWNPDHVIVAGDIVNRGPKPLECLELLLKKIKTQNWRALLGNHDQYVLQRADINEPLNEFEKQIFKHSQWTANLLKGCLQDLAALPLNFDIESPTKNPIHFTHASMAGIDKGIRKETTDEKITELFKPGYELVFVGHTHRPLIRTFNSTQIINAGSVGLPFDRDVRASYAKAEWKNETWELEIVRVEYDLEQAKQDFFDTGFIKQGPMPELIFDELCNARPRLSQWHKNFEETVRSGKTNFPESIAKLLQT